jgi:protein TonB
MFDRTLNSSWDDRSRRGLTALTSFTLQTLALAVLLVLPLLRPQGLPLLRQLSTPISLGQPLGGPVAARVRTGANNSAPSDAENIVWRAPSRIPRNISSDSGGASSDAGVSGPGIFGSVASGNENGMPNLFVSGTRPVVPAVRPAPAIAPLRVSHMSEGNLIRKVQPAYPPLARSARIQGAVLLQALISKQGGIVDLKVLAGHPMLVSAAIEAVRQWRYRPYVLNNEPVEVETQITVNFSLAGN